MRIKFYLLGFFPLLVIISAYFPLLLITSDGEHKQFLCLRLILAEMVCCCLVLQEAEVVNTNCSDSLPSHGRLF